MDKIRQNRLDNELDECSFHPETKPSSRLKRSKPELILLQQGEISKLKKAQLAEEVRQIQEREHTFKPVIDKKSKMIAEVRSQRINEENVLES